MNAELRTEEMVIDSTGNVFADLELPATDEDMLKVAIARVITNVLRKRELTQVQAAEIIGIDQSKVSALLRGRLKGFSVERLIKFLTLLGKDVDIRISGRFKNQPGRIKVAAA
jgi:predicted XRE-type DNA-binding protein